MSRIELITRIKASRKVCFDLSRNIDFHTKSLSFSEEKAVGGVISGLIGKDQEVTFRGRHFGAHHEHTSRITEFEPPSYFRDEMVSGRFKSFVHDHHFKECDGETLMKDVIEFESPLGVLGHIADVLILKKYLKRLIERRNEALKQEAERMEGVRR